MIPTKKQYAILKAMLVVEDVSTQLCHIQLIANELGFTTYENTRAILRRMSPHWVQSFSRPWGNTDWRLTDNGRVLANK